MKISVIIPTWNRIAVLPRAIESVIHQTYQPHEILVVDDGSEDGTAEMVRDRYPTVNLIMQSQKGVSAARNNGIKKAKGDWIGLLDSDDEWLPEKLANQVKALKNSGGSLFCHTDEIWIRNGKRVNQLKKHRKPEGRIYQQCLPLCCVSPSSALLHQDILQQVGLFDETFLACEDYELWLRVFSRYDALLVDQPLLIKYGGHSDQLSQAHWGMDRFRVRAIEGMLDKVKLDREDKKESISVLKQKCHILALGAAKRRKIEEAALYRAISDKYPTTPC